MAQAMLQNLGQKEVGISITNPIGTKGVKYGGFISSQLEELWLPNGLSSSYPPIIVYMPPKKDMGTTAKAKPKAKAKAKATAVAVAGATGAGTPAATAIPVPQIGVGVGGGVGGEQQAEEAQERAEMVKKEAEEAQKMVEREKK